MARVTIDVPATWLARIRLMARASDGAEIAVVRTGMVCFDYAPRRASRIPESFARILGA